MKTVYVASKGSYGTEFCEKFDTLEDLKHGIFDHEFNLFEDKRPVPYSEEGFVEAMKSGRYTMMRIELEEGEWITWDEYDGQSSPFVMAPTKSVVTNIPVQ